MIRSLLKNAPKSWKTFGRKRIEAIQSRSIRSAVKQQRLDKLMVRLCEIVPDIRQQYTTHTLDSAYVQLKVRAMHAFQISLVQKALELLRVDPEDALTIVDIGDSAGTHLQYLGKLHGQIRSLSVNLDEDAVMKIKSKGLEAIHARAEELGKYDISPDIFTSFETLEHLHAPLVLLESLSKVKCRALVVTVPYLAQSRVALDYIREARTGPAIAEYTHVFELAPQDWRPLFQFAGWRVAHDEIYRQYPTASALTVTRPLWKSLDYEGFYGAILFPDQRWREQYRG